MSITGSDLLLMRKAREQVTETIEKKTMEVAGGKASNDRDYGQRCGEIKGLRDALNLMEEIAQQLTGGDRPE